jgi:hypothetical protein
VHDRVAIPSLSCSVDNSTGLERPARQAKHPNSLEASEASAGSREQSIRAGPESQDISPIDHAFSDKRCRCKDGEALESMASHDSTSVYYSNVLIEQ